MSEEKKSPIISTSVSMGAGREKKEESKQGAAYKKVSIPWNILICADLGYSSNQPEQLRAATLNDLLASHNIILRGNLPASEGGEVFVEYPVKEITDLSIKKIKSQLALTADFQLVYDILRDLLNGSIKPADANQKIRTCTSDSALITEALYLTVPDAKQRPSSPQQPVNPQKSSALDSILGAVAVEDSPQEETAGKPAPSTPVGQLAEALTSDLVALPKDKINALIQRIEKAIEDDSTALQKQDFFKNPRAAWYGSRYIAKLVGRNDMVNVAVVSAPLEDAVSTIQSALQTLAQSNALPDIILFDYPLTFTNANMDILVGAGEIAEEYQSMLITHLSQDEPFLSRIPDADTLKPIFEEQAFIPYKRLKKNAFARTICLAAPDAVLDMRESVPVSVGGGWLILATILRKICDKRSPFEGGVTLADTGITTEYPLRNASGIERSHTIEALEMGITLLSEYIATQSGVPAVTAIDQEGIASQYTSFSYNLLTNRLLKITESVISEGGANSQEIAERLQRGLLEFLSGERLIHSENEVTVTPGDSGEIAIAINSEKTVDEYPIQIQYSVNA